MMLLHALLLFTFLLPSMAEPNLSRAIARISEARARAQSNRAKVRTNARNHLVRSSSSPRSKRQQEENPDFAEEPVLLHICSEDEDCALARENEEVSSEESLHHALEKLMEARTVLEGIEERGREAGAEDIDGGLRDAGPAIHSHTHSHIHPTGLHQNPFQRPHAHFPGSGLNLNLNHGLHQPGLIRPGLHQPDLIRPDLHQPGVIRPGLHTSTLPFTSDLHQSGLDQWHGTVPFHTSPFPSGHGSGGFPALPHTHLRDSGDGIDTLGSEQATVDELPEARESVFDPFHQRDEVMDFLEKHEVKGTPFFHHEDFSREANPSLEKLELLKALKLKKLQKLERKLLPEYTYDDLYNSRPYGGYGPHVPYESEEDYRAADPTIHKIKRKKMQKLQPQYYPPYPYNHYNGRYREAEDTQQAQMEENDDVREADPTFHKLKALKQKKLQKFQPQYYTPYHTVNPYGRLYKTADVSQETIDPSSSEETLQAPRLFDFPARRSDWDFSGNSKRSTDSQLDEVLRKQRKIVDTLHNSSKNDEDLKLVVNIANRTLTDVENRRNMTKRSIPLTRLISDPTVKLDVPKTIENFGTATKSVFEDEDAPMYHFKHLVGSSKNAMLAAMKIPPHNMIIPSDYEIVRVDDTPHHRPKHREAEDPLGFAHTFNRVGEMVRESIKSGQEAASHIGQVAHDARNMLNSARHAAPRLIVPYAQIPAIQDPRRRTPSKAILITPRIFDLAHETDGKKHSNANLLRLGHLMDAVGISKPNSKDLDLEKIIFEPRRLNQAKVDGRLAQLYSRFRDSFNDDANTVGEAVSTLEDAKISVGAQNLRDLLVKMKHELTTMVRNSPEDHKKKKYKSKKKKQQETKEMGMFIEKLFDGSTEAPQDEQVGAGLNLPPGLLQPFMGRASESQLHQFLQENGDETTKQHKNKPPSDHYHSNHDNQHNSASLGYVLGAVNPLMLERMYNQTVHIKGNSIEDPESLFSERPDVGDGGTVGNFAVNGPMLKPFMGQVQPGAVERFLDEYNHEKEGSQEEDK